MENKFKVGDKVRIKGKSVGDSLDRADIDATGIINCIRNDGSGKDTDNCICLTSIIRKNGLDSPNPSFFAPQDLESIKEEKKSMADLTYSDIKKGEIYEVKETCTKQCYMFNDKNGIYIKIDIIANGNFFSYDILNKNKKKVSSCCSCLKPEHLINPNLTSSKSMSSKLMNLKEKFVLALTKEPQKSFRKTGITDGDDILTEDGMQVFLSWLLHKKYAEEFKKEVVDALLESQKKENKE